MAEYNLPPHPPLLTRGNTGQSFAMSEVSVDPEEEAQRQAQEYLDQAWAPQSSRGSSAASYEDEHYRVAHPVGVPDSFDEVRATITAAGRDDIPDRAYNAWLCADCQRPPHGRWRCGVCVPRHRFHRQRGAGPDLEAAAELQQRLDQLGGARRKSKRRRTKRHKRRKRNTRRRRRKYRKRRRSRRGGKKRKTMRGGAPPAGMKSWLENDYDVQRARVSWQTKGKKIT